MTQKIAQFLVLVVLTLFLPFVLSATEQAPEILTIDGQKALITTLSPLEDYFTKDRVKPDFTKESNTRSTNLYRGYLGHWEIIEGLLFLKQVTVGRSSDECDIDCRVSGGADMKEYKLSRLFDSGITSRGKFARWYTGAFLAEVQPKEKHHQSGNYSTGSTTYQVVYVKNGGVRRRHILSSEQYQESRLEILDENRKYGRSATTLILEEFESYRECRRLRLVCQIE